MSALGWRPSQAILALINCFGIGVRFGLICFYLWNFATASFTIKFYGIRNRQRNSQRFVTNSLAEHQNGTRLGCGNWSKTKLHHVKVPSRYRIGNYTTKLYRGYIFTFHFVCLLVCHFWFEIVAWRCSLRQWLRKGLFPCIAKYLPSENQSIGQMKWNRVKRARNATRRFWIICRLELKSGKKPRLIALS